MSTEEPKSWKVVIKWTIKNFLMCPFSISEYIESPIIKLSTLSNTKWSLLVYPRGESSDNEEYIACYLQKPHADDVPEPIQIDYMLSVKSVSTEIMQIRCSKEIFRGSPLFIRRESISAFDGVLEIHCHLRESGDSPEAAEFKHLSPLVNPKGNHLQQSLKVQKAASICKDQILIRSSILVLHRSFICSFKDFDFEIQKEIVFPSLAFLEEVTLIAKMQLKHSEEVIYLEGIVCLAGEYAVATTCSIQILNSDLEICNSFENSHVYIPETKTCDWQFRYPLKSDIKNKNSYYLNFEFAISDGYILSDTEWLENVIYDPKFPAIRHSMNDFLKEEVFRLYNDKKFCDVTLRTADGSFDCHKTVLCAMSPVFAAMFESGMKESDTNNVLIDDLDSNTVTRMLNFMYSGAVLDLEFKSAVNLFCAADKYQIISLKRICSDFLKKNLNHGNVCEILSFSDARNDLNLKQSAIDYICKYKKEILFSSQWKELADKDIHLGYEILMKLVPE